MNLTSYRIHNVIFFDLYRLLQENIINKYFLLNLLKKKTKRKREKQTHLFK